jgi:antitoxin VapB
MVEMALNIKNEETHRLAQKVAAVTGESLTEAVTQALRERLARLERERSGGVADSLLAIGRDCAAHLPDWVRAVDHGDLLYDEQGVPK